MIHSFTATDVNCQSRGSTLPWDVSGAALIVITDDQGLVIYDGSLNVGSIVVYPVRTTTYTLTASNLILRTVTLTATSTMASNLLVVPVDGSTVYFNGGAVYAPGRYLITCCGGAFKWDGVTVGVNANDRAFLTSQAFKVSSEIGATIDAPGHYPGYPDLVASDAANCGLVQFLQHDGGPISIRLVLDSYLQSVGYDELPGFQITGPAPECVIAANSSPVIAGTAITLSWSVAHDADTITIDNGIGDVAASGSMTVSPTETTRYTITATGSGMTGDAYADALVGFPNAPVVVITPQCDGKILLVWGTLEFTTETLIERSEDGVNFTQIATVAAPVAGFQDIPPTPGTTYYYRLRGTDGINYSGYSAEVSAASLLAPPAVSNLAVSMVLGVPNLTWMPNSDSCIVKRGVAAGGESSLATIATVSGVSSRYADRTAINGVLYFYKVVQVNPCGSGSASNEVSIRPQANAGTWYS